MDEDFGSRLKKVTSADRREYSGKVRGNKLLKNSSPNLVAIERRWASVITGNCLLFVQIEA
jgi:hypothetical protein